MMSDDRRDLRDRNGVEGVEMNPADASRFSERWFAAWNAGDLDAIMACYDDAIEHTSPFVARFNAGVVGGDPRDGTLRGKSAVRAYFARALDTNPTPPGVTRFSPMHRAVGVSSVVLLYRRWTGELAGEARRIARRPTIVEWA